MKSYLPLIQASTLLSTVSETKILNFLANGRFKIVTYKKGSVLHFDGDHCNKLEIVLSGEIVIDRIDSDGNLLTITEFLPDDILGANLIFSKNPYYPMTITVQVTSILLEVEKELILELCFENRDFLKCYLEFISDYTLLLGDKIKHYVNRSIRESIINFIKYEYKQQNTTQIQLKLTKKALAERIGVQRTSLSRELQKMKNEGLILFDAETITVRDKTILT